MTSENLSKGPAFRLQSPWLSASLGFLLLIALVLTWIPSFDEAANDYVNEAIVDAGIAHALARGINAVISVVQSIEISVSLGAGFAVNLGEALDPLNDLIERFSAFMFYALAALGIKKLVLVASSSVIAKAIVSLAMISAFIIWITRGSLPTFLKGLLILLIMARFAFVVEVGISWSLDKLYFNAQQQEAVSTLDLAKNKLKSVEQEYLSQIEDSGVFRGAWSTAKTLVSADDQQGITALSIDAVIQLLVIFLVKSTLLPLAFVWLMYAVFRRVINT